MPVIHLNTQFIAESLYCPEGRRKLEYCDTNVRGLLVETRRSSPGQGTYFLRYKDRSGKTTYRKLGTTADTSLDEARQKAKELKAAITLGRYPGEDQPQESETLTFADFFTDHYLPYAKPRKRTWKKDEEIFRVRLRSLAPKKLTQITRQQVQALHTAIRDAGFAGATADHALKLARQILNLAVDYGYLEKNPAAGIKQFNFDNRLENYLNDEQLERLLAVLLTDSNRPVCLIVLFLLSTGARLAQATQADWKDIDREHRLWRIPATNSKSKRLHSIPLNDQAISVLDQLGTEGKYEKLFVSKKTGQPLKYVHKVWNRLRNEAGLPHLRLHDLRHSYASFLVNSGRTLYEVQRILQHSDPSVTTRYAHLSTKSLQDAADTASDIISGAMDRGG